MAESTPAGPDVPGPSADGVEGERLALQFDYFSDFISQLSANISTGGMFISTDRPQPEGTTFDFEFRLGVDFTLIRGRGKVLWIRSQRKGPRKARGMGVQFIDLDDTSRRVIERMVEQNRAAGEVVFDLDREGPRQPVDAGEERRVESRVFGGDAAALTAARASLEESDEKPSGPELRLLRQFERREAQLRFDLERAEAARAKVERRLVEFEAARGTDASELEERLADAVERQAAAERRAELADSTRRKVEGQLETAQAEVDRLGEAAKATEDQLLKELKKVKEAVGEADRRAQAVGGEVVSERTERRKLESQLDRANQALVRLKRESEEVQSRLRGELKSMADAGRKLEADLEQATAERDGLAGEREGVVRKLTAATDQVTTLEHRLQQQESRSGEAADRSATATREANERAERLAARVEELSAEANELREVRDRLTREITERRSGRDDLAGSLERANEEKAELAARNERLEAARGETEERLAATRRELEGRAAAESELENRLAKTAERLEEAQGALRGTQRELEVARAGEPLAVVADDPRSDRPASRRWLVPLLAGGVVGALAIFALGRWGASGLIPAFETQAPETGVVAEMPGGGGARPATGGARSPVSPSPAPGGTGEEEPLSGLAEAARPPSPVSADEAAPLRNPPAAVPPGPTAPVELPAEATPEARTAAAEASPTGAVRRAVLAWAEAWSAQDVSAYLASYAAQYDPGGGLERAAWAETRRVRLGRPEFIRIELGGLDVRLESDTRAVATFEQAYTSDTYADRVGKRLELELEEGEWRIVLEVAE